MEKKTSYWGLHIFYLNISRGVNQRAWYETRR